MKKADNFRHAVFFHIRAVNLRLYFTDRTSCDNDNIHADGQINFRITVSKAEDALSAVSADSVSYFFAGSNAEAVKGSAVRTDINNGIFTGGEPAFFVKGKKIPVIVKNFCIKHKNTYKAGGSAERPLIENKVD